MPTLESFFLVHGATFDSFVVEGEYRVGVEERGKKIGEEQKKRKKEVRSVGWFCRGKVKLHFQCNSLMCILLCEPKSDGSLLVINLG